MKEIYKANLHEIYKSKKTRTSQTDNDFKVKKSRWGKFYLLKNREEINLNMKFENQNELVHSEDYIFKNAIPESTTLVIFAPGKQGRN